MAARVSLVALAAVGAVAVIVIIGVVPPPTVDTTARRRDRTRAVLQVLRVDQAAALELPNDRVARRESRVDVDQPCEPTRVREGRAAAADRRRKHRPQLRRPFLRQHERRLVRPDLRASGSEIPDGETRTTDNTTNANRQRDPDEHDRAVTPKNIRVQGDVDLVPSEP